MQIFARSARCSTRSVFETLLSSPQRKIWTGISNHMEESIKQNLLVTLIVGLMSWVRKSQDLPSLV